MAKKQGCGYDCDLFDELGEHIQPNVPLSIYFCWWLKKTSPLLTSY